jgi:thymidine phosphorylase
VGRGIGPGLEAWDVVSVLRGDRAAPPDLRQRSLVLAGLILELSQSVPRGLGMQQAELLLEGGQAWKKFQAICAAQGGMREPPRARHTHAVTARRSGRISAVDNRRLARTARLAGAPQTPAAGIEFLTPLGTLVEKDQPLFVLHADAPGVLQYALDFMTGQPDIVTVGDSGEP